MIKRVNIKTLALEQLKEINHNGKIAILSKEEEDLELKNNFKWIN